MADNTYCSKCNAGCESQNTCNKCNSCESCNTKCNATSGCNTLQSFCATTGQSAGGFSFNQCVSSGEYFLSKTNWERLIKYINDAYAKGKENGGDSKLPSNSKDSNDYMTADMFNKVAAALGNLGSIGPNKPTSEGGAGLKTMQGGATGDYIWGTYFTTLEKYANNLQYKETQCNICNTDCNVTCDECQKCNEENCGSCNGSCESHTQTNATKCESCNTCQSCNNSCNTSCQRNCNNHTPPASGS